MEVAVYSHRCVEPSVRTEFECWPLFSLDAHSFPALWRGKGPLGDVAGLLGANRVFAKELQSVDPITFDPADIVFVHTVNVNQLFGLLSWYRGMRPERRPALVVLLRYGLDDNPRTKGVKTLLYWMFFVLCSKKPKARIVFTTDSSLLANQYEKLSGRPFSILPIPHLPVADAVGIGSWGGALAGKTVLAFLGTPREEKGYHLLPEAVAGVLREKSDLAFVVQSDVGQESSLCVREARDRLRALGQQVIVIERSLETREYYEILQAASAVLMAYSPQVYRARTSGVFAEALAFGKTVIVTAGTWLETQVSSLGTGVVCEAFTGEGLLRGIERYLSDRNGYDERAGKASVLWRTTHNPKTFVDRLLKVAEGGHD